MFHGSVSFSAVHVGGEKQVVGDNIGRDTSLSDEPVEGEKVGIPTLAELGCHDGITGVDSRTAIRIDRMTGVERRFIEVVLAYQLKNTIVEIEPISSQSRNWFR